MCVCVRACVCVYVNMYVSLQGTGELVHVATAKGHLDIVNYLIEGCHVDPACVQQVSIYLHMYGEIKIHNFYLFT